MALEPYRRHTATCPHRDKGQNYTKCKCPIWCDGELDGRRYRKSLKTRDWARAARRIGKLEEPGKKREPKTVSESIRLFHEARQGQTAKATQAKYRRVLGYLEKAAASKGLRGIDEFSVEDIDAYRTSRDICAVTWVKELEILRQFFEHCRVREWVDTNPAAAVDRPKNIKVAEVVPYTREEVIRILAACEAMGRGPYERLRARAMVLLLRYTALRIGDVALLERDRVQGDDINVRTMKSGAPVSLPMHPELQAALAALPAPRGDERGKYLFWTGNGSPDSMVRAAERTLTAVFKRSGVPHAHAHRFRHTLATELLEQGWTYHDVAEVLGNSAAIVEKHYGKWSRGRQDRISGMLRSVFSVQNWYTTEKQPVTYRA
jgi:integrase